ncbi:hypothetical protein VB264_19580 [Arcicella aquatica]|uniref:Uncharacterized protein n=1 Tax=Arcicella aquatica TaxID=217141 RepID=A0ABU5QSD1_9BACT|nr:hypothetical protein [Arcicella aquatica]MEA5260008.1 hypothetical protein [Arcicella aquatica]
MDKISINELNDFYLETLEHCGSFLLQEDDECISYHLFEEFDIGVNSFFEKESVERLFQAGLISELKMGKSMILRDFIFEIQESNEWDIHYVKTSSRWKDILERADELRNIF